MEPDNSLESFKKLVQFVSAAGLDKTDDEQFGLIMVLEQFEKLPKMTQLAIIKAGVDCKEVNIESKPAESELDIIEKENKLELIRLKSWLVKSIIYFVLALFGGTILLSVVLKGKIGFEAFTALFDTVMKVFKLIVLGS